MTVLPKLPWPFATLWLLNACGPRLVCDDGEEIEFEQVGLSYDAYKDTTGYYGPEPYLPFQEGFNGTIYETRDAWDALIAALESKDPIPNEDFSTRDAILYGLDGCSGVEVSFLGACSDGDSREIKVATKPVRGPVCQAYIPYYQVLLLPKGGPISVVEQE